jgi:hypothetical protein
MEAFAENVKRVNYQAIKVPFTGSWQFSATSSIIIRMFDGNYFEIGTAVHSSNWNSTSSGFYHATHSVWLQELHSQQYKGLWLQEDLLWPLDIQYSTHVPVPAQV